MTVITRFAPSPTGYLHIGGARTALFNYLFAKANAGRFLLRIEDTDKERSDLKAQNAIISGLQWLGLNWDDEVVLQSQRIERHKQVALDLLAQGKAYYCFTSQEEIEEQRSHALENKTHFIFKSKWRDADPSSYPQDIKPVIRLKAPLTGQTIIKDKLQGDVIIQNDHLDDMVCLRADGTPTYMLAVVVDDHDMGITHIIRGDDHLGNAARQMLIYEAMGWQVPVFVHIPLIHGPDGAKLSKRHGALGIESYRDLGYLPEALCNYLLRLGWSHGDDEIIPINLAIQWFNLDHLGKAPARLDFSKMQHLNAHYLRAYSEEALTNMVLEHLRLEHKISDESASYILLGMPSLKLRAELLTELTDLARIYVIDYPLEYSEDATIEIKNCDKTLLQEAVNTIEALTTFDLDSIKTALTHLSAKENVKLGKLMQPLRALLTGMTSSPSVFEIIAIIGKDNTLKRLQAKVDHVKLDL